VANHRYRPVSRSRTLRGLRPSALCSAWRPGRLAERLSGRS